jgi:catechol-2,3-dioxygenase
MTPLTIRHVGLHVRSIEEEIEFLSVLGARVTAIGNMKRARIAFVSLDGVLHHSFALFEDGTPVPSGDSQKEKIGLDHVAMQTESREAVDDWAAKLTANGISVKGPLTWGPDIGGSKESSGSYTIYFHDPNGICFEIFAEPMTVREYREKAAEEQTTTTHRA